MMFKKRMKADEARELFLSSFRPLDQTEYLAIDKCDGRVIARDIISGIDVPHYRRAAMDGFAVRSSDTLGAGTNSPVILELRQQIEKGTCVRVHTGSSVPDGADAVVMIEDTRNLDDSVEILVQVPPFKNVGEIGEDIRNGELLLNRGHLIRPCDVAVLASAGIRNIEVFRKPRVAIIPTGEEVVGRDKDELKPGEVYETNGIMTKLYVSTWGGDPFLEEIVTDDPEKIKEALIKGMATDMIIVSGGTSVGKRDHVPAVVGSLGKLLAHGVGISPGKPVALGIINGKPVVCMPGYPVAGIVALFFFARAALRKLANLPDVPDRIIPAVLSEKITSRIGFKTFARVRLQDGKAIPIATSGAGILSSVSKADGFVIIPEYVEGLNAGEKVDVVLID